MTTHAPGRDGVAPPAGSTSRAVVSEPGSAPDIGARHRARPTRWPLLAVCGLCGGAGASTLAYLVALAEARRRCESVLVGDTGGSSGAIACYTGVEAPRSLVEAAAHVTAGLPAGQLVAKDSNGVRVLATGPRFTPDCPREGIELLLDHARERYALTVIDCGTLAREADRVALAKASHLAWVLPASTSGLRRARPVLDAINPNLLARELVVARHDDRERKLPLRALKRLAEYRHAPLVLLPSVPELAAGKSAKALEIAQVPLQAIHGALAR
jgi:Flp pilus assembly CpaE family ATPase